MKFAQPANRIAAVSITAVSITPVSITPMSTTAMFAAVVFVGAMAAGCAPVEERQSGESIDDAWITSKVKGAFVKNPVLTANEITVETYKGQVQLGGFVADAGDVGRAAAVAGGVKGVKSVRNDIQIR